MLCGGSNHAQKGSDENEHHDQRSQLVQISPAQSYPCQRIRDYKHSECVELLRVVDQLRPKLFHSARVWLLFIQEKLRPSPPINVKWLFENRLLRLVK